MTGLTRKKRGLMQTGSDRSIRRARTLSLLGVVCGLALFVRPADGQRNRTSTASMVIPSLGIVVSRTGIVAGSRDNGGNIFASTSAITTNNGPYQLQAKLTVPFTDKNKANIVNDVQALNPITHTYQSLSTSTWVTVAIGPGGPNRPNTISLYVNWGKSSSKDPGQIPSIQLTYQVIPH